MIKEMRGAPMQSAQYLRSSWLASDFAIEIGVLIKQHPTGPPTSAGGSEDAGEGQQDRVGRTSFEAVLGAVAEVRDLVAVGPSGGHRGRGGGRGAGRPVDDHADQAGGQGGRPGRA